MSQTEVLSQKTKDLVEEWLKYDKVRYFDVEAMKTHFLRTPEKLEIC